MEEFKKTRNEQIIEGQAAVDIQDGEYAWGFRVSQNQGEMKRLNKVKLELEPSSSSVLKGIDFKLMPQDFMVVVGRIGSGKTSLLYSIMDETVKKAGNHQVRGRLAYVEQEPFIFSGSI